MRKTMRKPTILLVACTLAMASRAAETFVECESFAELGGWVVDAY